MVTAGVYLLIRLSPIFYFTPTTLTLISIIGALTAFFAASSGLVQNDLKRVIAYSTSSQLGYMVLACGLFYFDISFFHLINHAFFKALLFLSSGIIIHSFFGQQDIRYMGGFLPFLPFVYSVFLIGSLSLAGFPFLTGFYSKDLILELAFSTYTLSSYFVFWLALLTVALTSFYSFRLLYFLFYHKPFSTNAHDRTTIVGRANAFGLLPLAILAIPSVCFGYLFKDLFVGLGSQFLQIPKVLDIDGEVIPLTWKLLPLIFAFTGFGVSYLIYFYLFPGVAVLWPATYSFFAYKWYFDVLYNRLAYNTLLISYIFPFKAMDRGILEWLGAHGLGNELKKYGSKLLYPEQIFNYTLFFFISVLSIIIGYSLFYFGLLNTAPFYPLLALYLVALDQHSRYNVQPRPQMGTVGRTIGGPDRP